MEMSKLPSLEHKAQTSFEMLLVLAVVISISIFILGNYFEVHETTYALAVMKVGITSKLNDLNKFYVLRKIDFTQPSLSRIDFNITTYPTDLKDLNVEETIQDINAHTKFSTINVKFN